MEVKTNYTLHTSLLEVTSFYALFCMHEDGNQSLCNTCQKREWSSGKGISSDITIQFLY